MRSELDVIRKLISVGQISDAGALLWEVLDVIPDPVVIVNHDGHIVLVNAAFERMTGYRGADLMGSSVEMLVPDSKKEMHKQFRDRYIADPKPRLMAIGADTVVRLPDGSEAPILAELLPLHSGEYVLVKARLKDEK